MIQKLLKGQKFYTKKDLKAFDLLAYLAEAEGFPLLYNPGAFEVRIPYISRKWTKNDRGKAFAEVLARRPYWRQVVAYNNEYDNLKDSWDKMIASRPAGIPAIDEKWSLTKIAPPIKIKYKYEDGEIPYIKRYFSVGGDKTGLFTPVKQQKGGKDFTIEEWDDLWDNYLND